MPGVAQKPANKRQKQEVVPPCVDRSMVVMDIVHLCPQAAEIMAAYGLHCFSCTVGGSESLEDGCAMHGFDDETIDALIEDLNEMIRNEPPRPQTLQITKPAAGALKDIVKEEKREKDVLIVIADSQGGFCMEFRSEPDADDQAFESDEGADMTVYASPLTLWHIGGGKIDFRDGRFKLDLPEDGCCKGDASKCTCQGGTGSCGCS